MFTALRAKAKIFFWIVIAAFLITIFLFWGMDVDSSKTRGTVAFSVNGEDISIRTYEDAVSRYLQQYSSQDISDDFRRQLRKQASDDLIDAEILKQTSEKMGIYVTKEQIKGQAVEEFPNPDLYRRYLYQAPAAWWQNLEESIDRRIKISRARWPLLDAVYVSDSEWAKIVSDLYWEADLSHMLFRPVSEVTDSDVREYYDAHRYKILEPTKVRTREILFKLAEDATDTEVLEVTARAQKVFELARAGKDFKALAGKFSEAPDAEDGGDMGFYAPGDMKEEIEKVAFGTWDIGQINDTFVRSEFGLHILKLEARIPATIKPWSEKLADEIRSNAVTDTHWEKAKARAQRVLEIVKKFPEQFAVLASTQSQAPSAKKGGRVGWVPRLVFPSNYERENLIGEVTQGSVIEHAIGRAAFETPIGSIAPDPVRSSFGWHILKVNDRRPMSTATPTDTDVTTIREAYRRLMSDETLGLWLKEQKKKAKIEFKIDIE